MLSDFKKDYKKAMNYFQKALDIKDKLGENKGIATCLYSIAELSFIDDDNNVSLSDLERCLEIRRKLGNADRILEVLALHLIIQQGNGANIRENRKEIETMMPTAKNISNITYFRLYQIYNQIADENSSI